MTLLTEAYFRDIDFDRSKFLESVAPSQQSEADIEEEMQFTLEGSMYELSSTIVNFAPEDEHAATLKAMLLAYDNALNGRTQADRDVSMANFIVFAKSHCNVCLTAVRDSVVKG
jgi:hypothetical protein